MGSWGGGGGGLTPQRIHLIVTADRGGYCGQGASNLIAKNCGGNAGKLLENSGKLPENCRNIVVP